ncbi:MAG: hypothetical protein ACRD45_22820 [Bryobacteraceae bacterium]
MNAGIPETYGQIGPWQRYVAKEHAARDAYIATVQSAHREYLTGPWPDREAYQHVETSAWVTYYAAGREAWRHYTRELMPPPPPPTHSAAPYLTRDSAGEVWPADPHRPDQPTFTERHGGTP